MLLSDSYPLISTSLTKCITTSILRIKLCFLTDGLHLFPEGYSVSHQTQRLLGLLNDQSNYYVKYTPASLSKSYTPSCDYCILSSTLAALSCTCFQVSEWGQDSHGIAHLSYKNLRPHFQEKLFRPSLKQVLFLAVLLNYWRLLNSDVKEKPFFTLEDTCLHCP